MRDDEWRNTQGIMDEFGGSNATELIGGTYQRVVADLDVDVARAGGLEVEPGRAREGGQLDEHPERARLLLHDAAVSSAPAARVNGVDVAARGHQHAQTLQPAAPRGRGRGGRDVADADVDGRRGWKRRVRRQKER